MNLPTKLRRGGNGPGPILFTLSCESTPDVSRPIGNRPQFDNRIDNLPHTLRIGKPDHDCQGLSVAHRRFPEGCCAALARVSPPPQRIASSLQSQFRSRLISWCLVCSQPLPTLL